MKKLIQYIHMEILWYATVFGIDHWKIFNLDWKRIKIDAMFFFNALAISWIATCGIVFCIYTSLENSEDARFWWTTGMSSSILYIMMGFLPSNKKINP